MNDFYTEQLVKRKTPMSEKFVVVILGILTVLSVVLVLAMPILLFVPVVLAVLTYFANLRTDLEFEYLYVNGELDIDKIMAKDKKKEGIFGKDKRFGSNGAAGLGSLTCISEHKDI